MRRIILLNGCPGSGKDTVSDYLVKNYNYKTIAFKDLAFKSVYEHYGISKETYMSMYNTRALKDIPNELLGGKTPRKAMQYVVEEVNKPVLGRDYLAKATIDIILKDEYSDYVVSDFGLDEEEITVHYKLKHENYTVVYVDRDECDWSNDTRRKRYVIDHTIYNNKDHNNLYMQLDNILKI